MSVAYQHAASAEKMISWLIWFLTEKLFKSIEVSYSTFALIIQNLILIFRVVLSMIWLHYIPIVIDETIVF